MYTFAWIIFGIISISVAAERGSVCLTPNGDTGTCIPLASCPQIRRAVTYQTADAVQYAKNSQCGYNDDEDSSLVCCEFTDNNLRINGVVTTPRPSTSPRKVSSVVRVPNTTTLQYTTVRSTIRPTLTTTFQTTVKQGFRDTTQSSLETVILPDRNSCGTHSPELNIRKGTATQIREFPWVVSLKYYPTIYRSSGSSASLRCTGTLIHKRYVLTAAECLDIPGFYLNAITIGRWNYSSSHDCYKRSRNSEICSVPTDIPVEEEIVNQGYYAGNYDCNIALLRLSENIEFDDFIRPICLPRKHLPPEEPDTVLQTSGWNVNHSGSHWGGKFKGKAWIVNNKRCEEIDLNFEQTHPNSGCIESVKTNNTCIDNSGSPLMNTYVVPNETLKWYQEGIVYKGLGCHKWPVLASYPRITDHIDWILKNMRN